MAKNEQKPKPIISKMFGVLCDIRNLLKEISSQNKELLELARNNKESDFITPK